MGTYYKDTIAWIWNKNFKRTKTERQSLSFSLSLSFSHTSTQRVSLGISVSLCSVVLFPHSSVLRGILMVSSVSTLPSCLCTRLSLWSLAHTWIELLSLVPYSINSHPLPLSQIQFNLAFLSTGL